MGSTIAKKRSAERAVSVNTETPTEMSLAHSETLQSISPNGHESSTYTVNVNGTHVRITCRRKEINIYSLYCTWGESASRLYAFGDLIGEPSERVTSFRTRFDIDTRYILIPNQLPATRAAPTRMYADRNAFSVLRARLQPSSWMCDVYTRQKARRN